MRLVSRLPYPGTSIQLFLVCASLYCSWYIAQLRGAAKTRHLIQHKCLISNNIPYTSKVQTEHEVNTIQFNVPCKSTQGKNARERWKQFHLFTSFSPQEKRMCFLRNLFFKELLNLEFLQTKSLQKCFFRDHKIISNPFQVIFEHKNIFSCSN